MLCLLKKKNQLLQIIESEKVIDLTLRIIVAFNYFSDPHTPHQMQILNIETYLWKTRFKIADHAS